MGPAAPFILLFIAGAATIVQYSQAKAQARNQRAALRAQERMQAAQIRREKIHARRQARIARAQAVAAGAQQTGGTVNSAAQGAAGSAISQLRGNESFLDVMATNQRQQISAELGAVSAAESAATWGAIASFATSAAGAVGKA